MNQKGFAPILIVILIALAVGGYLLYQNRAQPDPLPQLSDNTQNKPTIPTQQITKPSTIPAQQVAQPSPVSATAKPNTTVDYRKEQILQANRQSQQSECFKNVNEISLLTCKSEIGWSSVEWDKLTEEEKKKEDLFWKCYDRVSISEGNKCSNQYLDVTKKRNAYFDCLAKEVDVVKYCGGATGYTQVNNFPKDKEALYSQCIEQTRVEKEDKCSTETGYNPS